MEQQKITSFKDLIIWQKSIVLAKQVYLLCGKIPKEEIYGIQSQIKRSAISVPSNIAEGKMRSTRKDFTQFLHIARGSLSELQTQLILVEEIFNISTKTEQDLCIEIDKMIFMMIKKLKD